MLKGNPYLPNVSADLGPMHTRVLRDECGERYFWAALELSQSFWLQGKPAQAILQIDKAFLARVGGDELALMVRAYRALRWFLENRVEGLFMGNPVRHFQHLASRMSGPRAEVRKVRAWLCFYLASVVLPEGEFPRDEEQIVQENLKIPELMELLGEVVLLEGEGEVFLEVLRGERV